MDNVYFVLGVLGSCWIGGFNIGCAINYLRNEKMLLFGVSIMYTIATVILMIIGAINHLMGL